jgi:hypothetical protein
MITGHRGNGAPGPDLTGPENQPTAARSGVAAITAGQTLIRTFGCSSCETVNGSENTDSRLFIVNALSLTDAGRAATAGGTAMRLFNIEAA